jgi:hypothetical protein
MTDKHTGTGPTEAAPPMPPGACTDDAIGSASVRLDIAIPLPDGYLSAVDEFESLRDSAAAFVKGLRMLAERGWTEHHGSGYRDDDLEVRVYKLERTNIAERDALEHVDTAEAACGAINFSDFDFVRGEPVHLTTGASSEKNDSRE